ncbi:MAG: hypothetical protein WAT53_00895 [Nitrosomonas sp.]|jgi:predicted small secreted protein|nr:hypothetical protein [Nitrosomonas sp.]MCC7135572.1 hypothetical protein [Nitrosomonas sp.]
MINKKQRLIIVVLLATLPLLSGCWTLVAAGAGAYGGYKMKEKGYTLQNPVTKEKSTKTDRKNQQPR